jgi:kumamolisin
VGAPEYFWQKVAKVPATVYQAPNSDPGFIDAFFAVASQNTVGSVSTSWGESETYVASAVAAGQETASYEAAFDEAFLEMAGQGQSVFAAAGDAGAYDASRYLGSTSLSVDTPGTARTLRCRAAPPCRGAAR